MKVSVYLGSSPICDPQYNDLAFELGKALATRNHTLVYGGSNVGTMKYLADGALSMNGYVVGVIPRGFAGSREIREAGINIIREDLNELIWTEDFAERKKVMEDRGDCCIVMPGSYGTLDELFTYACNRSIDKHEKPVIILNHKGYYEPIKQLIENMAKAGFLKAHLVNMISFCDTVDDAIDAVERLA